MGLSIFPLAPRTKFPLAGSHGHLDASADASPWKKRSDCNIGISCIASRVVVVDLDAFDAADDLPGPLPHTWSVDTKRGGHHLYRVPAGHEPIFKGVPGRVDIKWRGFAVLPPSIHPSGHVYTWEASSRCDEISIAVAPPWLVGTERPRRTYDPDGDANDSYLARAFDAAGWLGEPLNDGKIAVRCPWADEHSADRYGRRTGLGEDSSTVILPPTKGSLRVGVFSCKHGHCLDRRTDDAIAALPRDAHIAAAREYREELGSIAHILARIEAAHA